MRCLTGVLSRNFCERIYHVCEVRMVKRNGLSDSFVPGKRKHKFTKEDLEREIKYMDIRAYCLKKLEKTKEYHDKYWTLTDENFIPYMRGIHEATQDFLGWCEGRIDSE